MATTQTEGIVLRKKSYREYDRIYVVYTEKFGKLELLAQGAAKIQSKLAGHLEPFVSAQLFIAHGKSRDRIAGSVITRSNSSLRSSLEGISLASFLAESTDALTRPYHKDSRIFHAFSRFLAYLDELVKSNASQIKLHLATQAALLQLLSMAGFRPQLEKCATCQKDLDGTVAFSAQKEGFICQNCPDPDNKSLFISFETVDFLRQITTGNFRTPLKVVSQSLLREMQAVTGSFLEAVVQREVLSRRFVRI